MAAEEFLRPLLRCVACRSELIGSNGSAELICRACRSGYPVVDGIPVLLPWAPGGLGSHKAGQAAFFDAADAGWETVRPAGAPSFYRGLLEHNFEEAVSAIRALLPGATVLTVCGGSGMDAEYLARTGARVIASDLSLEAARRARERGRLRDVPLTPLVADVEALPFADRSVDVVFVHDGLHHLEDPLAGLTEMARVARLAVSVNEPAQAVATRLAVRMRLSEDREEAGNRVARVDPDAITSALERAGLDVVRRNRYAMVYRHEPGRVSALLSIPPLRRAANAALTGFNAVLGGIGNKLTVQAVRPDVRT
jgi:SAM-dependent methyltransferase/uncharacterized protein YbaR (Trm112 family)